MHCCHLSCCCHSKSLISDLLLPCLSSDSWIWSCDNATIYRRLLLSKNNFSCSKRRKIGQKIEQCVFMCELSAAFLMPHRHICQEWIWICGKLHSCSQNVLLLSCWLASKITWDLDSSSTWLPFHWLNINTPPEPQQAVTVRTSPFPDYT